MIGDKNDTDSEKVKKSIHVRMRRLLRTTRWVNLTMKLLFIVVGGFLLSISAFPIDDLARMKSDPKAWAGIVGAVFVLIGAFYVAITDHGLAGALEDGRRATDIADKKKLQLAEAQSHVDLYQDAVDGLMGLYNCWINVRTVLEGALVDNMVDERKLVESCLKAIQNDLCTTLGFMSKYHWTICIYQASKDDEQMFCIAHKRAIECDIGETRNWKFGNGIAGMVYSQRNEIVVPDARHPRAGSAYIGNGNTEKPIDNDRYRSMFGAPIEITGDDEAWGVVVATSQYPNHFLEQPDLGVEYQEAVRTLSHICALAVAICRLNEKNATKGS